MVNARQRKRLTYNKRIELNEDFKILWEKISKKIRYSVDFETEALIERAVDKIRRMDKIQARISIAMGSIDLEGRALAKPFK